ncbi:MAG TPA: PHP-associated domain-containing protein [Thermoleophilia bacterium]|nr:PHP-associated domain-containing protein [Thermoleophilia bacterium]
MNVDLHTHTYPASDCSRISHMDYIAWCVDNGIEAVALTNHGDVSDNRELRPALAAEGVLLIDGVEISTLFGDFVVFSPDLDYLETLHAVQDAPHAGAVPDDAAVVWVHPGAGGGRSGSVYYPGIEHMVAGFVDAVEVYNGQWLESRYVAIAEQMANALHVARTGGSDAHRLDSLMCCYTELPDPLTGTADVVRALHLGHALPRRRQAATQRRRRFRIF